MDALVPKYIAAIPSPGLDAAGRFEYSVAPDPPHRWRLNVKVGGFGFRHMRYDPSKQYEVPVMELRDGWVMVDP
jgi:hypothetical protein